MLFADWRETRWTNRLLQRIPPEFWGILYAEYGIMVYPSALTEQVDLHGLNTDKTFTDCYQGHIGKPLYPRLVQTQTDRVQSC